MIEPPTTRSSCAPTSGLNGDAPTSEHSGPRRVDPHEHAHRRQQPESLDLVANGSARRAEPMPRSIRAGNPQLNPVQVVVARGRDFRVADAATGSHEVRVRPVVRRRAIPTLSRCSISPANSQLTVCKSGVRMRWNAHPARRPSHVLGAVMIDETPAADGRALALREGSANVHRAGTAERHITRRYLERSPALAEPVCPLRTRTQSRSAHRDLSSDPSRGCSHPDPRLGETRGLRRTGAVKAAIAGYSLCNRANHA